MVEKSQSATQGSLTNRRGFIKSAGAVAGGLIACNLNVSLAHADALTREVRDKLTADEIIAAMKKGNERFRKGEGSSRNLRAEQTASADGQYPAAMILGCVDSRVPTEVIMDLGIGYAFSARVAGNVISGDILGSMEFACKAAGAKVIVVIGHTSCGAIKGAIDNVELGNLTGLLNRIRPAVNSTTFPGERTSKNLAFVDAVARKNVELTMEDIRTKSDVLRELESNQSVKIVGAMYNLKTAVVEFFADGPSAG